MGPQYPDEVLRGTEVAMRQTFGSSCHGAGRKLSRHQAKKMARGRPIFTELAERDELIARDFTLDPTFNIYVASRDLMRERRGPVAMPTGKARPARPA